MTICNNPDRFTVIAATCVKLSQQEKRDVITLYSHVYIPV